MKPIVLATLIATLPGLALADGFTRSWVGPRGASGTTTGHCNASGGTATCQSTGTLTGVAGKTATRTSSGTYTAQGGTRQTVTTGPNGRSGTVTRGWSR